MQALERALVIGLFGGAALVLTNLYSRRGPLIYPVYAAILFTLGLSLSRATALGFGARLAATSAAPGHAPAWAFPLLILTLFAASAGVAYVSS
jgi:hypothetical protein